MKAEEIHDWKEQNKGKQLHGKQNRCVMQNTRNMRCEVRNR